MIPYDEMAAKAAELAAALESHHIEPGKASACWSLAKAMICAGATLLQCADQVEGEDLLMALDRIETEATAARRGMQALILDVVMLRQLLKNPPQYAADPLKGRK